MSYEIDAIKNELQRAKGELHRKTDYEDYNRLRQTVNNLESKISNIVRAIYELEMKIDRMNET